MNGPSYFDGAAQEAAKIIIAPEADGGVALSVMAALRTIYDPEIPVNVYDLGLIYEIHVKTQGCVEIAMTLTAPGCPVASEIVRMVEETVAAVDGVSRVAVRLVFDPPWDRSRMSEDALLELGLI